MRLKRARQMQDSTKDMLAYKEIVDRALTVSERCCACGACVEKGFQGRESSGRGGHEAIARSQDLIQQVTHARCSVNDLTLVIQLLRDRYVTGVCRVCGLMAFPSSEE